jgi:hypothetical protein
VIGDSLCVACIRGGKLLFNNFDLWFGFVTARCHPTVRPTTYYTTTTTVLHKQHHEETRAVISVNY